MSGIVGVLMRNGDAADRTAVARMAATTPYRAAAGHWMIESPSFCAIRQITRTTPEDEYERGPIVSAGANDAILFDGRLDNREELAAALGIRRGAAAAVSDAGLVLAGWQAWQEETPRRLVGDFAFVVWDSRRRRVFCARDTMGVRPFFYHVSARVFVFGSELRQVLAHPLVPCAPDEAAAAGVLQSELRSPEQTLFRDVRRLPHAHALVVSGDSEQLERYWQIDLAREIRCRDDEEYARSFREIFDGAVRARTRSARPVGAYLSGGLDSSSVLATARLVAPDQALTAFSLVFPGDSRADERPYIDAVVRHCGVAGVQLRPPPLDLARLYNEIRAGRDVPEPPNDMAGTSVRRAMAERGIRVALTGSGGDYALTGSYFHFAELLARGRVSAAIRRGRDALHRRGAGWRDLRLINHAVWPLLPVQLRHVLRPLARRIDRGPHAPWVPRAFARRTGLLRDRPVCEVPVSQLSRVHLWNGFENAWAHALDDRYHRGSAEWGLEERHPFFDRRVIEFALGLPDDQRWKNGQTKYVLRRAMADRLPDMVCSRPDSSKADFSGLFVDALEAIGGETFFRRLQIADAGWVEPRVLRDMCRRMISRRVAGDPVYGDLARDLWRVASVEFWYAATFGEWEAGRATWMTRRTPVRMNVRIPAVAASSITHPC